MKTQSEPKYNGLIAPCGMNCGLCIGPLRDKRPCGGCFKMDDEKWKCKACYAGLCVHRAFCLNYKTSSICNTS